MAEKSIFEVLIVPLAICAVGFYATMSTTNTQIENSNRQNDTQIKSSETIADTQAERSRHNHLENKDLDITKSVITILSSANGCNAQNEVNLLIAMATSEQSEKLKELYLEKCAAYGEKKIMDDLNKAVRQSEKNEVENIISELTGENRRTARTNLSSLFLKKKDLVSDIMADAIKANPKSYGIPLGILVALANANYEFKTGSNLGKSLSLIKKNPNFKDETFKNWYYKVVPKND